jgi:hypothetical protein
MSVKCQYSNFCNLYKSDSFNCNKEPEGCGNWRFISKYQSLTSCPKRTSLPFYVKYREHLIVMILKLCLRLTKPQQEKKSSYVLESFINPKKPKSLTFLEKKRKSILSKIFNVCFRLSTAHGYKRK